MAILPEKERAALDYIVRHLAETGHPPTLKGLAVALGGRNKTTGLGWVRSLVEKGRLVWVAAAAGHGGVYVPAGVNYVPPSRVIVRHCGHCKAEFPLREARVKWGCGRYCSRECERAGRVARSLIGFANRFWKRVNRGHAGECWPWGRTLSKSGYGLISRGGVSVRAHRVAYELHHGAAPPADKIVCHSCDNPPCCNPAHLFLGTHQDNHDDMVRKGRHPTHRSVGRKRPVRRGPPNPNWRPRLNAETVKAIRGRWEGGGVTISGLARESGLHLNTVYRIVHRLTWASVS